MDMYDDENFNDGFDEEALSKKVRMYLWKHLFGYAWVYRREMIVLGIWFATQILSGAFTPTGQPGVAFWAHIGGFVAGMALVPLFKRSDVQLFQPARSRPFEIERRRGPWG